MSNLQKFNITLEEFDSEVGKLKEVSHAYQKLESLIVSYEKITKQLEQNRTELMTITALQKDQREEIFTLIRTVEKQFLSEQGQFSKYMEVEFAKYQERARQEMERDLKAQTREIVEGYKKMQTAIWIVGGVSVSILMLLLMKL